MKEQIEQELGFKITEEQFQSSKDQACKKLKRIILQCGDTGGIRHKPEYLMELVLEQVIAGILSEATAWVAGNMLNMEKEHLANCQSTLSEQPYCSMP